MPKPLKYERHMELWEGEQPNELKDFIVFACYDYYPQGGLEDIVISFDSLAEAKAFVETSFTLDKKGEKHWSYDRFTVVRRSDWATVLEANVRHRQISTA